MNTKLTFLSNGSGTSAEFSWPGGRGVFAVKATGYGSVALQFQLPDGVTWVTPSGCSLVADGGVVVDLHPCLVRVVATTATNVFAEMREIPV